MVLVSVVMVLKLVVEDCHCSTFPRLPDRVSVPEFTPEQTVIGPVMVPGIVLGVTVMVYGADVTAAQVGVETTARKLVVTEIRL